MSGLLDTSVIIGAEAGRPVGELPALAAISVITLEELRLGVLLADTDAVTARRQATLDRVAREFDPLPVDVRVARTCAELRAAARRSHRRIGPFDALIAATARVHDLALYTQDAGFEGLPGVEVVRV